MAAETGDEPKPVRFADSAPTIAVEHCVGCEEHQWCTTHTVKVTCMTPVDFREETVEAEGDEGEPTVVRTATKWCQAEFPSMKSLHQHCQAEHRRAAPGDVQYSLRTKYESTLEAFRAAVLERLPNAAFAINPPPSESFVRLLDRTCKHEFALGMEGRYSYQAWLDRQYGNTYVQGNAECMHAHESASRTRYPRLGAFEVTAFGATGQPVYAYSKLDTGMWPLLRSVSAEQVAERQRRKLEKRRQAMRFRPALRRGDDPSAARCRPRISVVDKLCRKLQVAHMQALQRQLPAGLAPVCERAVLFPHQRSPDATQPRDLLMARVLDWELSTPLSRKPQWPPRSPRGGGGGNPDSPRRSGADAVFEVLQSMPADTELTYEDVLVTLLTEPLPTVCDGMREAIADEDQRQAYLGAVAEARLQHELGGSPKASPRSPRASSPRSPRAASPRSPQPQQPEISPRSQPASSAASSPRRVDPDALDARREIEAERQQAIALKREADERIRLAEEMTFKAEEMMARAQAAMGSGSGRGSRSGSDGSSDSKAAGASDGKGDELAPAKSSEGDDLAPAKSSEAPAKSAEDEGDDLAPAKSSEDDDLAPAKSSEDEGDDDLAPAKSAEGEGDDLAPAKSAEDEATDEATEAPDKSTEPPQHAEDDKKTSSDEATSEYASYYESDFATDTGLGPETGDEYGEDDFEDIEEGAEEGAGDGEGEYHSDWYSDA